MEEGYKYYKDLSDKVDNIKSVKDVKEFKNINLKTRIEGRKASSNKKEINQMFMVEQIFKKAFNI